MKAASALLLLSALTAVVGKKKEEALNRETTPFWLRDKTDGKSCADSGMNRFGL